MPKQAPAKTTGSYGRKRPKYRVARLADIPSLVVHRHRMWSDIGYRTEEEILEHDARYLRWIKPRLRSGELVGIIAETDRTGPVGSGLIWFRPDQPRPQIPTLITPYILSMYTAPEWRGTGIASRILRDLVAVCRKEGYPSVVLHASEQGRSVYGRLGFERTWEMRYWVDPRIRRNRALAAAKAERRKKKGLDRAR